MTVPTISALTKKTTVPLVAILFLIGFASRLFPHPANFAPIGAIALFGALYLPRRLAIVLPLLAVFVSDLVIGFYSLPLMAAVYGSFVLTALIGPTIRRRRSFGAVVLATLAGSALFFLVTNAAVWGFGTLYPHTGAGLGQSYIMALPFFRNSLLGDFFYTGILVGGLEALRLGKKRFLFKPEQAL